MSLVCLHGFLGLPSDWDFLRDEFDVIAPELRVIPSRVDGEESPSFLSQGIPPLRFAQGRNDTLVGYSMGGRLALQALLAGAKYRRAILISTRVSDAEPDRRERDERWARRFESDDWESLMRDWNAQPIFGGHSMPRFERDFDRAELARQLREWSPAVLPPVAPRLHEITTPTLWIAGARDVKYVEEARRGAELTHSELVVVEGAAHRVPWEQPREFVRACERITG